tara:strand:- start:416 stop:556 length:141 start_codon:yes stop_codon:yes gene_type:complete
MELGLLLQAAMIRKVIAVKAHAGADLNNGGVLNSPLKKYIFLLIFN